MTGDRINSASNANKTSVHKFRVFESVKMQVYVFFLVIFGLLAVNGNEQAPQERILKGFAKYPTLQNALKSLGADLTSMKPPGTPDNIKIATDLQAVFDAIETDKIELTASAQTQFTNLITKLQSIPSTAPLDLSIFAPVFDIIKSLFASHVATSG